MGRMQDCRMMACGSRADDAVANAWFADYFDASRREFPDLRGGALAKTKTLIAGRLPAAGPVS